jgi:hypothetical protein
VDIERCRREIAAIEALIGAGHQDLQGLCLALSDWCAESRLIEWEMGLRMVNARQVEARRAEGADENATC